MITDVIPLKTNHETAIRRAIIAIVYAYTTGTWFPQKQADGLRYWLDGSKLRVDQGVYFLKRKTIPLDRVTDITLSQGPLLRHFGLWSMTIQTAGRGSHGHPEATLIGLENPEEIREALLNARDAVGITG